MYFYVLQIFLQIFESGRHNTYKATNMYNLSCQIYIQQIIKEN